MNLKHKQNELVSSSLFGIFAQLIGKKTFAHDFPEKNFSLFKMNDCYFDMDYYYLLGMFHKGNQMY